MVSSSPRTAPKVSCMGTKCSQSFYDALGGKHRSGELFACILDTRIESIDGIDGVGPAETRKIICGAPASDRQIRIEDLALLYADDRFTVTVYSYDFEASVPFNPANFQGRRAREVFDPQTARDAMGGSYPAWLRSCAQNLPFVPDETLAYSQKIGEAFLAEHSGVQMAYVLARAPGVLAVDPDVFADLFYGNFGMVDVAARVLVDRLTQNVTSREAELLCKYLGNVTPGEFDGLCIRALERLGVLRAASQVNVPPLREHDHFDQDGEFDPLSELLDLDPPSLLMDELRSRAFLLELELGVPGLATMLGCSSDPETSRLSIYDLALYRARQHPECVSAQAVVDQRVARLAGVLAERHQLVTYYAKSTLHIESVFNGSGKPLHHGGMPLAHVALVGFTLDGRVFSFEDSDQLAPNGSVTFFSPDTTKNCFWHRCVWDAISGGKGEVLGYAERLADGLDRLERSRGGMFERVESDFYDELVANGGEYDGERDARARLLAVLPLV